MADNTVVIFTGDNGRCHLRGKSKPREEFYDLEADPHEANHPAESTHFRKELNEMRVQLDACASR